jgi:hypothetical protein
MRAAAAGVPELAGRSLERYSAALAVTKKAHAFDSAAAEAHLERVLKSAADGTESV